MEVCHLDPIDGRFRKEVVSLQPPGELTGYAHPNCYLNTTHNCSKQISREHYISRSVLEKLGEFIKISGAHWLSDGTSLETSVGNMTAKILCGRHNESLSPLDTEAGIFLGALIDVFREFRRKTLSRKPTFRLASGEAQELWMLKVACGHYFGIGTSDGVRLDKNYAIDMSKIEKAFFRREWEPRCGLYFKAAVGDRLKIEEHVKVASLSDEERRQVTGVTIGLHGLEMDLLFDAGNTNTGPWTALVKRPTELVWRRGHRHISIILTWPIGTPERSIVFEKSWDLT